MKINRSFASKNIDSRQGKSPEYLVLHYTQVPLATTLGIFMNDATLAEEDAGYFTNTTTKLIDLCKSAVSAHYVLAESGEIYQLVEETDSARHAGVSYWHGVENLNEQSIGIELVNLGFDCLNHFPKDRGLRVLGSDNIWCSYAEQQVAQAIGLCQDILKRHDIKPYNVLGHSDIACSRKCDPGPLFPWQQLAKAGVGLWHKGSASTLDTDNMPDNPVLWMQQKLSEFGYYCVPSGKVDDCTTDTLKAFQMHFRPSNIDGHIDLECLKIIDSLCQQKIEHQNTRI